MTLTDVKYTATVFSSVTKGRHISASGCCQYNSVVINATHCLFFFNRSRVGGRDRKKSPGAEQRTGSNA